MVKKKRKINFKLRKKKGVRPGKKGDVIPLKLGGIDEELLEVWDPSKPVKENYKKIGLIPDLNKMVTLEQKVDLHMKLPPPEKAHVPKLSYSEQRYIEALLKKHGSNFRRMQLDTKLNIYQKSVGELKRMAAIFERDGAVAPPLEIPQERPKKDISEVRPESKKRKRRREIQDQLDKELILEGESSASDE